VQSLKGRYVKDGVPTTSALVAGAPTIGLDR
jgi:hypothetical protein